MSRSVVWRREASDAASWHQDEAVNATIYILREMGPTGFLLKEEGESKKFKVFLGDPHSCTCPVFLKEKDLCKHISWVILKKFRVPRQNPITWQLGLVEREINEILKGIAANQASNPSAAARRLAKSTPSEEEASEEDGDEPGSMKQRPISEDDVCPICQDEFFAKHLPVTYCKFGCGNNIHIKCMKVWADHQKTQGETTIKCPLCREDFGPFSLLQEEMRNSSVRNTKAERLGQHLATTCKKCRVSPIVGKCYKCTVCVEYHLCQNCFITPIHGEHNFEFRERPNQKWRAAQRGTGSVLPSALVNAMMNRDLGDRDYEMLLQLDNQAAQAPSDLSQETIQSFPVERVRKNGLLLAPGQQCLVCLQCYSEGQFVRKLPCKHKFHRECIDNWLLHQHATCPIDGTVYTNDSVKAFREAQKIRQQQRISNQQPKNNKVVRGKQDDLVLEVPGVGIVTTGVRPTGTNGLLRSGHLGRAPTRANNQDTGMAISGVGLANGTDIGPPTTGTQSGTESPITSPLHPVPPSIPRPHHGNADLRIRSQTNLGSQADSSNSRPPSGQQTRGDSARRNRARPRTLQGTSSRNRSGSKTRTQHSDFLPSNDLYVGNEESDLLMFENASRVQYEQNRLGRSSITSQHNQGIPRDTSPANPYSTSSRHGFARQMKDGDRLHGAEDIVNMEDLAHLHIGNNPTTLSHGSSGRLRHGHIAAAGPREQSQAMGSPSSSRQSSAHSLPGSPSHSLTKNSLYIGADPSSTEGCLRNFILNSIAQKNKSSVPKKQKNSLRDAAHGSEHHWGQVREMSGEGNDIVLSGNAVQAYDSDA